MPKALPPIVSWIEVAAIAVIAAAGGFGLGASLSDLIFPHPLPWMVVHQAKAIDGNTIATTMLLHVDGLVVPQLDRRECEEEPVLAARARDRVQFLLDQGNVRVLFLGENKYGQISANFVAGDRPIGPVMLREGLARKENGMVARWCPTAADATPPPARRMTAEAW